MPVDVIRGNNDSDRRNIAMKQQSFHMYEWTLNGFLVWQKIQCEESEDTKWRNEDWRFLIIFSLEDWRESLTSTSVKIVSFIISSLLDPQQWVLVAYRGSNYG